MALHQGTSASTTILTAILLIVIEVICLSLDFMALEIGCASSRFSMAMMYVRWSIATGHA
ncbi:hypothetical protein EV421DRAFT_1896155 [Armillaria borealis]|uniref:Uncharacterized protein n=1 Tax=Armillaria borealis TaxID=47425 RepID=A0AA39N4D0_9AGAR|nr:hypothetical protein EV421DRAFT_1896155 [Armillaria borealis]